MISVITWPNVLLVVYFGAIVAGIVLSFIKQQPRRCNIRIITGVLSVPILWVLIIGILGAIFWFPFDKEPPTLAELQRDFSSKRADLEMILRMSDDDEMFSRIAPDFVDRMADNPNEIGRYMKNDPNAKLQESRWNAYRKIYERNGIKLGIQRDTEHDAFIMVDSIGLLNRGHVTGYLYCAPTDQVDANRFHACLQHQDRGERKYDPNNIFYGWNDGLG